MSSINTWARLYSLTAVHPRDGTLLPAHQISREYRESLHTTLLKELSDSILLRSSSASDSCSPIIRIHSFILSSKLCLVADLAFMVGVVLIFLESIDKQEEQPTRYDVEWNIKSSPLCPSARKVLTRSFAERNNEHLLLFYFQSRTIDLRISQPCKLYLTSTHNPTIIQWSSL